MEPHRYGDMVNSHLKVCFLTAPLLGRTPRIVEYTTITHLVLRYSCTVLCRTLVYSYTVSTPLSTCAPRALSRHTALPSGIRPPPACDAPMPCHRCLMRHATFMPHGESHQKQRKLDRAAAPMLERARRLAAHKPQPHFHTKDSLRACPTSHSHTALCS